MSIFVLKIIAVFFMIVDHVKYAFPICKNEFTIYFGRIAFPIFAFCIVQGYIHTHDFVKYIKRLLMAGFISEIPYLLFETLPTLQRFGLNIMFTLFLGLLAIKLYDFFGRKVKSWIFVIGIAIFASIIKVDYGAFGIFLVFSFYIFKDSKVKTLLASCIVVSLKYLYRILILNVGFTEYPIKNWICTLIPLFLLLFYNKKKGPGMKWFFYIFYPLHFLILYVLSPFTFNLI